MMRTEAGRDSAQQGADGENDEAHHEEPLAADHGWQASR